MDAPTLNEITDLVHRRVESRLCEDLIKEIYASYSGTCVKLTFILGNHLDTNTLASMAVRYNHYFADVHPKYVIKLLDQPNHFKADTDTYIIWQYGTGFIIPISYGGG